MDKIFNVLFLCTGNSSRSIMAEALMNTLGKGKFKAYSAGSHPTGEVHPLALELAKTIKYPPENLRSKSWDEFSEPGAPVMDFVFTVCDKAAGEPCPFWPGQPITAHWGFSDPAAVQGSDDVKHKAFINIFQQIRSRVQLLISLPIAKLDRIALQKEVDNIGTQS